MKERDWWCLGSGLLLGAGVGVIPTDALLGYGLLVVGAIGVQVIIMKDWL